MKNDTLVAIWNTIDSIEPCATDEQRREILSGAIERLMKLAESGANDIWYPLGYAYYNFPNRHPDSLEAQKCREYLLLAIEQNNEPDLAHLYLAHQHYDYDEHELSLQQIDQINQANLDETLEIRCKELQLCAAIRKDGYMASSELISKYANFITSLEDDDIPPINLMNALEILKEQHKLPQSSSDTLAKLDDAYPIMTDRWFSKLLQNEKLS